MKFTTSSKFILATLASSSSFQALAAPTESRESRGLPDTGAVTSAAGPALGALGSLPVGVPGGAPGAPQGGSQPPPPNRELTLTSPSRGLS